MFIIFLARHADIEQASVVEWFECELLGEEPGGSYLGRSAIYLLIVSGSVCPFGDYKYGARSYVCMYVCSEGEPVLDYRLGRKTHCSYSSSLHAD